MAKKIITLKKDKISPKYFEYKVTLKIKLEVDTKAKELTEEKALSLAERDLEFKSVIDDLFFSAVTDIQIVK